VKFVDLITELLDSGIVGVRRELLVGVFGARKKKKIRIVIYRTIC
jgi:hypothetical protein